ncbi:MAG TPA: biosynthetic arginine decarboxylase [Phycisphaerae bacterium]|nr:biosynthetic arginine decarboxylase [Phycisphaerae bacterium]
MANQLTATIPVPGAAAPATHMINLNSSWSVQDSMETYNIANWGKGYFSINPEGNVTVLPEKNPHRSIDLKKLVDQLSLRGIQLPVLVRFTNILNHRLAEMHDTFQTAIQENNYQGKHICVYPIKVNQQRHVVEEILSIGSKYGWGLEAGSKPELLVVMALTNGTDTPIICNGFKDDEFIETVILAQKLGKNIIPVIEKFTELELLIKYGQKHGVRPRMGMRVKLATRGSGRWESSGGARSKFGLFVAEMLKALDYLKERNMQDCIKLLHFHLGSQITNIRTIKSALNEAARVYAELSRAGAGMEYLDVGGGLGVDYDGSQTNFESSINYTLQEYASDVIFRVKSVCDECGVKHPTIISESGRAMVAYHSVLVFNVLGVSGFDYFDIPAELPSNEDVPQPVKDLFDAYRDINKKNFLEIYHDASQQRDEALNLFNLGYLSLELRSLSEKLFWGICGKILRVLKEIDYVGDDFESLEAQLSDTYFCNFSLFQSMPDSWAIKQLFPIMPIHRLKEEPTRRGVLADITCDSDGKVDSFIDLRDVKKTLELHEYNGQDYLLGVFLVGAYQEILGDLHNLLGDTNAVHVELDENGDIHIDEVVRGDTVREVLQYVQFNADELLDRMHKTVERAVREKTVSVEESALLLRFYESGLHGYTYLEEPHDR